MSICWASFLGWLVVLCPSLWCQLVGWARGTGDLTAWGLG